ncbi:RNA polymerase sigma factor [Micromonospora sp. CA-111912]|uniref:RNA polymerase sigma factor n=1 Tax=Micromonospora sp. CA-111912 TaxID=3239955 RepID=UPI003D8BF953
MAGGNAHAKGADPRETFYELHHRRLAAFIQRRVADTGLAEQIEQETWAHMMRGWDTLRAPEAVLIRVAWWRIKNWYASKGHADVVPGDDVVGTKVEKWQARWSATSDPSSTVPSRVDLQRAIGALPPRQRQVLILIGVEDLTQKQVAELLGISAETVKTNYNKAKAALRATPTLAGYAPQRATTQEVTR